MNYCSDTFECHGHSLWCLADDVSHLLYLARLTARRRTGLRQLHRGRPGPVFWAVYRRHERADMTRWPNVSAREACSTASEPHSAAATPWGVPLPPALAGPR